MIHSLDVDGGWDKVMKTFFSTYVRMGIGIVLGAVMAVPTTVPVRVRAEEFMLATMDEIGDGAEVATILFDAELMEEEKIDEGNSVPVGMLTKEEGEKEEEERREGKAGEEELGPI